ncbi:MULTISPECIES: RNA-binding domain-containing protein [Spirulina sp. CCY15215]|uniref:RNA-binding domain-containing protein n=1 Tax=Spirulina sp. CCY15215 TaxID=2767591 RepID=UPI00194F2866|nr:RNA-binding domain-containing protein [Spirulina major]
MQRENVHLLVVEDNNRFLDELLEWLRDFGYQEIVTARSVSEAQTELAHPCDIVIADMRMEQDDSGFTILDWVTQNNLSTVVIILTANDTVTGCRKAFRAGAWDYISKNMPGNPFDALDISIQDAIAYLNRWGSRPNQQWIDEHYNELTAQYWGQWIAIANQTVIEQAESENELRKRLDERKLRQFTITIKKIGDLRPMSELIELPESETLEFKSTLQWDIRQNSKNSKLVTNVLKTIVAFLNTSGGTLLIGVEDNGDIFGLTQDINCLKEGSLDKFERHLGQLIERDIGLQFMPKIKIRFEQINEQYICGIYVQPSKKRVFLKSNQGIIFYVRTGNATRALSVPEIYEYL